MQARGWFLGGAVAVIAGAAAVRAGRNRRAPERSPTRPHLGWATCSAPGARVYEATFGRLLTGLYEAIAADLGNTASGPHLHILDVGAGPGGLAAALAAQFPDARVTTIDIDVDMARLAAARMARDGLIGRVHVAVGNVAALPLADQCVDLVTSSFSVHHWPDAAAGFSEVRRVLRPGGRAIVYDLPDWWHRFETHGPPLAVAAAAGGFPAARCTWLRWPGRLTAVRRLEAASTDAAPAGSTQARPTSR